MVRDIHVQFSSIEASILVANSQKNTHTTEFLPFGLDLTALVRSQWNRSANGTPLF